MSVWPRKHGRWTLTVSLLTMLAMGDQASAQPVPEGGCKSPFDRTGEVGRWLIARQPVGQLTRSEIFWHLYVYPSCAAAEATKGPRGTVIESLGKVWLLSIEGADWRPAGGERVAVIGPLPVIAGERYTAEYTEVIFTPGMTSSIHTHPGPEAWYTLAGDTLGDAARQANRARRRPTRNSAGRHADAPHCHRHRAASLARAHLGRIVTAGYRQRRARLGAKGLCLN